MNGRMYDAVLGRMLSPDKYVQDGTNTQAYNRYSYVMNNPLKYTDPSGWLRLADAPVEANIDDTRGGSGGGSRYIGGLDLTGSGNIFNSWGTTMLSGMFYAPSQQYYMNPVTGSFMFGNKVIDRKDYINKTASGDIRPRSTVKINYDYVYEYKKNDPNTKINERYENISIDMDGATAQATGPLIVGQDYNLVTTMRSGLTLDCNSIYIGGGPTTTKPNNSWYAGINNFSLLIGSRSVQIQNITFEFPAGIAVGANNNDIQKIRTTYLNDIIFSFFNAYDKTNVVSNYSMNSVNIINTFMGNLNEFMTSGTAIPFNSMNSATGTFQAYFTAGNPIRCTYP